MTTIDRTKRRATPADLVLILRLTFSTAPLRAISVVLLTMISRASDTLFAWTLKLIVDAAFPRDGGPVDVKGLYFAGGFLAAGMAISIITGVGGFYLRLGLGERVGQRIDRDILDLTAKIPGIEHQERADFLDELTLLRDQRGSIGQSIGAMVENIGVLVRLGLSILLLARIDPLLVALPLFAIPSLFASAIAQKWIIAAFQETAEWRRRGELLYELATTPGPAKELRIFGTAPDMIRRHNEDFIEFDRTANRARVRGTLLTTGGWLVFSLGYIGVLVLVAVRAVNGQATVGDVLLALTLAGAVNGQVSGVVQIVGWLMETLKVVGRYRWLRDYARRQPAAGTLSPPLHLGRGIEFEDVSFTYPGTDREILEHVDLVLPAGATIAIVGDNGAGKSTIVKLLGRFYEPSAGRILVDGVPLAAIEPEAWRERLSAGFQDFARYDLEAGEVVGIGYLPDLVDDVAVDAALGRASGRDVVDSLDRGLRTPLGRSFDDGIELSGGQWQKLALGRAMMREVPLLLLLDEPTASLDPETEHALFERYAAAATRAGRETGAITILVSHRFSTVRMADLIVVIDGGRVAEVGAHQDLVGRGGLYAELYEIQARQYR